MWKMNFDTVLYLYAMGYRVPICASTHLMAVSNNESRFLDMLAIATITAAAVKKLSSEIPARNEKIAENIQNTQSK